MEIERLDWKDELMVEGDSKGKGQQPKKNKYSVSTNTSLILI